jgi:hypothetical protein
MDRGNLNPLKGIFSTFSWDAEIILAILRDLLRFVGINLFAPH